MLNKTRQRHISNINVYAHSPDTLISTVTNRSQMSTNMHFNLLKPTGYVIHQHFNIQQLYALPTLYLYVLYLSENKQRLVPLTA